MFYSGGFRSGVWEYIRKWELAFSPNLRGLTPALFTHLGPPLMKWFQRQQQQQQQQQRHHEPFDCGVKLATGAIDELQRAV